MFKFFTQKNALALWVCEAGLSSPWPPMDWGPVCVWGTIYISACQPMGTGVPSSLGREEQTCDCTPFIFILSGERRGPSRFEW